ncbi:hypothetical protein [Methanosphaera sp.]
MIDYTTYFLEFEEENKGKKIPRKYILQFLMQVQANNTPLQEWKKEQDIYRQCSEYSEKTTRLYDTKLTNFINYCIDKETRKHQKKKCPLKKKTTKIYDTQTKFREANNIKGNELL